jgi:mRNA interferase MazF
VRRGDIYLCDFGNPIGHEQGFQRPALIVSHDEMARYGLPVVLPLTRTKRGYPTHVELDSVLPVTSYIQCEQIRTVSAERMIRHLGSISDLNLMRVEQVLRRILVL